MSICGSAEGANTSICIAIHLMLRKVHQCCRHRELFGITSSQRTDGVLTSSFWLHLLHFHDFLRLLITHLSSPTYATTPKFRKGWRNVVRYIDWIVCAALISSFGHTPDHLNRHSFQLIAVNADDEFIFNLFPTRIENYAVTREYPDFSIM